MLVFNPIGTSCPQRGLEGGLVAPVRTKQPDALRFSAGLVPDLFRVEVGRPVASDGINRGLVPCVQAEAIPQPEGVNGERAGYQSRTASLVLSRPSD
jgi:hypothetical protein